MQTTEMTTTRGKDQFYPTPPSVAREMLKGLDFSYIHSVLEPSAGKGNLIDAAVRAHYSRNPYRGYSLDVDVCEIDPYLRQICKYNFSKEKRDEIRERYAPLDRMSYSNRTERQNEELKRLRHELDVLDHADVHIVHDDFLTYRTYKHYDLILMNPPFSDGDQHLLRAIEMQKRGGSIICLLNAETIRKPYTSTRQLLARQLADLNADIQFVEDAFSSDAERKADVDVAIIRIHIEPRVEKSDIWERMKKAVAEENIPDVELHALVTGDYIEQAIQLYNTEVAATMELVRQYKALAPYMSRKINPEDSFDKTPILTLAVGDDNHTIGFDISKYMRTVRMKYWRALFTNKQFTGRLTSDLQKQYHENVERMANYEFSAFNIKQVALEMNASMTQGVEKAILDLFDKLTAEHSWYPECQNNKHYFNGWATNKAHKIGNKCIIPTYGMFSSYSWHKETFEVSTAYGVISDIEKAFDYLDGGRTEEIDLLTRLRAACACGKTRNIECKYFKVDLFKKGTTHIKFYPEAMQLVERLNIYASQKKGWLPPNYGKASYVNMDAEEKAVIDSFHGDGGDGSGEKAYTEVMNNAAYYLTEPTQKLPALMEATE